MPTEGVPRSSRVTVTVDQHVDSEIVEQLDNSGYFGLGKGKGCTRAELLLYAMAVGWQNHLRIPISKPLSGGFARTESFSDKVSTIIKVVQFAESDFDDPDCLRDTNAGYNLMEQYANGGFKLIEGELADRMGSEEKANKVIAELNKQYDELFPK